MTPEEHPKILYIPPTYGEQTSGFAALSRDPDLEQRIIKIFKDHEFKVVVGECEDDNNPNALGIHVDSLPFVNDRSQYFKFKDNKALQAGATMPREFTWEEMLTTDAPVVAKRRRSNCGEDKHLLTTYEQKMRFLVWGLNAQALFWVKGDTPDIQYQHAQELCLERQKCIERLAGLTNNQKVKKKAYQESERGMTIVQKSFQFQKYISLYSGRNDSYRIVVDAKGEIHYIMLISSKFELEEHDMSNWGDHPWDALHRNPPGTFMTYLFLNHPQSPTYIPRYKIVSNMAQGGHGILLYSQTASKPEYTTKERGSVSK